MDVNSAGAIGFMKLGPRGRTKGTKRNRKIGLPLGRTADPGHLDAVIYYPRLLAELALEGAMTVTNSGLFELRLA
jgi:hypothetical protein